MPQTRHNQTNNNTNQTSNQTNVTGPLVATTAQNEGTIYRRLREEIAKQAGILGATLTPEQIDNISKRIFPPGSSMSWDISDMRNIENYVKNMATDSIVAGITSVREQQLKDELQAKTDAYQNPTITPEISGTINQQFKSILGRDATPEELTHFGNVLARKEGTAYDIQTAIKGTQEYIDKQNAIQQEQYRTEAEAARNQYAQETHALTDEAFKRALPEILSAYMKAGKLDSSGVDNAVTKWKAKLANERASTIAGLGYDAAVRGQGYKREDYLANQTNAYQNYLRAIQPSLYNQQQALQSQAYQQYQSPLDLFNRQYQAGQNQIARSYQQQDYNQKKSDYDRYFQANQDAQREAALWGFGGQVLGAGIQGATYGLTKSDGRLKKNVSKIADAIEKIKQLKGVSYDWINGEPNNAGIIAQDLEAILPQGVRDINGIKMIDPMAVIGLLVEAVKELSERNK